MVAEKYMLISKKLHIQFLIKGCVIKQFSGKRLVLINKRFLFKRNCNIFGKLSGSFFSSHGVHANTFLEIILKYTADGNGMYIQNYK